MAFAITTPAVEEPLTVSDVKYQLPWPQDNSDWDLWIQSAIVAARQFAETRTHKTLITSTVRQVLDRFPFRIQLETAPVQSISSVEYLDVDGNWNTVSTSDYVADLVSEPARITPAFGCVWPVPVPQIASVRVNYIAGYGSRKDVPEGIKVWMKARIAAMWQNREEVVVGSGRLTIAQLPFMDSMLDPFRVDLF